MLFCLINQAVFNQLTFFSHKSSKKYLIYKDYR